MVKMKKKYILENSIKINFLDKDFYNIWMDLIILVVFKMVKKRVMVYFMILMGHVIKDSSKIIKNMEMAKKFL